MSKRVALGLATCDCEVTEVGSPELEELKRRRRSRSGAYWRRAKIITW